MYAKIFQLEPGYAKLNDDIMISKYYVYDMVSEKERISHVTKDDEIYDLGALSYFYHVDIFDISGKLVISNGKEIGEIVPTNIERNLYYIYKNDFVEALKNDIIDGLSSRRSFKKISHDIDSLYDYFVNHVKRSPFRHDTYFISQYKLYPPDPIFLKYINDLNTDKLFIVGVFAYKFR